MNNDFASAFSSKLAALLFLPLALFLCAQAAYGMGSAPIKYTVGVRSLAVITPDNARLGVMVWYPASRYQSEYSTKFGLWTMRAERNLAPAKIVSPVILISHDMVDSNIAYHEIAGELAAAGFIVIVPSHSGDNLENATASYSAAALYYRPLQLHEALAAVQNEPDFKDKLDTQRIGLFGSGAGALTILQMCGVDLDYNAYKGYCAGTNASPSVSLNFNTSANAASSSSTANGGASNSANAAASAVNASANAASSSSTATGGASNSANAAASAVNASANADAALCSSWAQNRMLRMNADIGEVRNMHGSKAFVPLLNNVKGVGLLSPGWLVLANKSDVAALRVPVAALFAGQGGLYPPVKNSDDVQRLFPQPVYDTLNYQVLVEADHYSLHSECPPELMKSTPEVCGRILGKERKLLSEKRNAYFVSFFQAALGMPLPLP